MPWRKSRGRLWREIAPETIANRGNAGLARAAAGIYSPCMNPFPPPGDKKQLEEGLVFTPKFDADGLVPAMAIDAATKEPLMLAYMNAESLRMTLELGEAVYWSRSRQEIWHKGKTSGQVQRVVEIRTDCDQDALVIYVEQLGGGCCHTGRNDCFYRKVAGRDPEGSVALSFHPPA
jgi:phosphoribosyl-AMP cyclohydrolase